MCSGEILIILSFIAPLIYSLVACLWIEPGSSHKRIIRQTFIAKKSKDGSHTATARVADKSSGNML